MPVTHSLKAGLIMLSVLCTQGCVINIEENQFEELDFNPQREMMGSFEPSQLTVATWNVEHLAYPIDTGCKPRTESDINAMREYVNNVDADVFALQEVASEQAVRLLFPSDTWQVLMSPRPDSETYECRGSGRESTQQKIAYAVKNGININSVRGLSELGLNNPGLRYGLELTIQSELGAIKLLNVHMKSGCFVDNYSRSDRESCQTFAQQAPILDAWVETQESEGIQYVLLGDFNHRLSAPYNHLTRQLMTNSDGSESTLYNTTGQLIGCHPYYPAPIDLVFVGGMSDNKYDYTYQAHTFNNMAPKAMLSDHCAVSLQIER